MDREYEALTRGTGLVDLAGWTTVAVRGSDRATFLHSFTTNDIKRLAPGMGCEAFVTSPQGRTLGHVLVFCEPERLVLSTTPRQAAALMAHFERYVITEDVEFVDLTSERGVLLVAGACAEATLASCSGGEALQAMLAHGAVRLGGCEVVLRRVPYAGANSYFVEMEGRDREAVGEALLAAGGGIADEAAGEVVRLEAGFPLFGRDISEENLPQEVGRDRQAISFTKGCYLGQETVARIDAVGHVNQLLRGLHFGGADMPPVGTTLRVEGQRVGQVTSVAWSKRLGGPLGLGYVRRQYAKAGSELASDCGGATVVELPLA